MCGIVAYKGNKPITFKSIIGMAYRNCHRGEDGIGIIYEEDGKLKVIKNLYSLTELYGGILSKDRFYSRKRVGSFEYVCHDDNIYEDEQNKFTAYVEKLLDRRSKFVYLHHRKGTYGEVTLENQHPILINDKYYIHNGTAYGIEGVKRYLELMNGIEFKTDTDTEVIATLYNLLMDKFDNDTDVVISEMGSMFPSGFGILIEISKDETAKIIKDFSRNIWTYGLDDGGYILVSEPNPHISKYTYIGMVADGIYNIEELHYYDYTEHYKSAEYSWLHPQYDSDFYKESSLKCDFCKDTKFTKKTHAIGNHPAKSALSKDICFECLVKWEVTSEKEENILNNKINTYGKYLGGNSKRFEVMEYANT